MSTRLTTGGTPVTSWRRLTHADLPAPYLYGVIRPLSVHYRLNGAACAPPGVADPRVSTYHRPMPNRLAGETSPYLLQHANNPVDWYPWGPDALARAKLLDRPIFLSIGYAACHWCHVMERESFEDEATARLLNERFVAIKVDREERPDLDSIYMGAVQAMTGGGGWPMSVFLAPGRRPVLRRHVLPGHTAPRDAVVPAGPRGRLRGVGDAAWRGPCGRPAARSARSRSRPGASGPAAGPDPTSFEAFAAVDDALAGVLRHAERRRGVPRPSSRSR